VKQYIDDSRMTLLEWLTTTPPPPVLYHYTTQNGLLGILQGNCIWATDARYLNDSSEYSFGLERIVHAIKMESKNAINKEEAANLSAICEDLSPVFSVCVVSLSSEGDLLSQWRAYAGSPGGFALGMRPDYLREAAHSQGFYLAPCLYTATDQQEAVSRLLNEIKERMANSKEWGLREQGTCRAAATRLAMLLKSDSFEEEREWRLISRPKKIKELEFRPGASMLVPFFRFALDERRDTYLDSVKVGPTPHRELAIRATRMLLRKLELPQPDHMTTETRVPFRNW
jgi:hypothetical protein